MQLIYSTDWDDCVLCDQRSGIAQRQYHIICISNATVDKPVPDRIDIGIVALQAGQSINEYMSERINKLIRIISWKFSNVLWRSFDTGAR